MAKSRRAPFFQNQNFDTFVLKTEQERSPIMKTAFKWAGIAVVTLAAMSATACNTVQGAGQDIESAGQKIEEVAK